MKPSFLIASFLLLGCSVPITRSGYFITSAATTYRDSCQSLTQGVADFAAVSGFLPAPVGGTSHSASPTLARFIRGHVTIYVYREGSSCMVVTQGHSWISPETTERRLFDALSARGLPVRLERKNYQDMIDIIPFAP